MTGTAPGLVIDDYLFQNGENGNFHVIKLNRGYDTLGEVTVAPELLHHIPSWDQDLQQVASDFSVENSVAIYENIAYFANSSGLGQGWNLTGLKAGQAPTRVFRFWTGDDVDATITIDEDGMLYVGVEYEKHNARSQDVGQMLKLDPSKPDDPIVWGAQDMAAGVAGIWGTPALYKDIVIFGTDAGDMLGLDRATGQERWRFHVVRAWSSPVVVDDVLFIGDCTGNLYACDVADTTAAGAAVGHEGRWLHRDDAGGLEGRAVLRRPVGQALRHRRHVAQALAPHPTGHARLRPVAA